MIPLEIFVGVFVPIALAVIVGVLATLWLIGAMVRLIRFAWSCRR